MAVDRQHIPLSLGTLYAEVDPPVEWTLAGGSLWVVPDDMPPGRGRLVHVISPHAGGEVRAYVWADDGTLYVRRPCSPLDWRECDIAVAEALGVSRIVPPLRDWKADRCPGGECACHAWQGSLFGGAP